MAEKISVNLTLGYSNTDFTRILKIEDVPNSALSSVVTNVKAVNASLAGGTDGGLADFFRSDDYDATDPNNVVGKLTGIVAVSSDVSDDTQII